MPEYEAEISNSVQTNINSGGNPCRLDRMENPFTETYSLNKNGESMLFLSHGPNLVTSQKETNEDVCKEKKNSSSNKENEVQNTFTSKNENKYDLINDELENLDSISDDSRDKDFEIHEYTESESEMCSSVNSDEIMTPLVNRPEVTTSRKVLPTQSIIEKILEQVC